LDRLRAAHARPRRVDEAADALGVGGVEILRRHVLPGAAPLLLVQATFGLSGAIVAEASLSFLGLGAAPPTPSWGAMLDEGRLFMLVAPHAILVPATALAVTVLALQTLGDGLGDLLELRD
jgi:peptide/nickel transport system permease protein